jgi:hypothetical protein
MAEANASDAPRPLAGYSVLMATFTTAAAAMAIIGARRSNSDEYDLKDLGLLALATHSISRIVAKDRVTSVVRAPFVEDAKLPEGDVPDSNASEVKEAAGQLITCPHCLGPWVATGLLTGLRVAPRETRFLATVFALADVSSFLQRVYARLEEDHSRAR